MPLLPAIWPQLEGIIASRKERYNSPAAVAKRERAAARKVAKAALGIAADDETALTQPFRRPT